MSNSWSWVYRLDPSSVRQHSCMIIKYFLLLSLCSADSRNFKRSEKKVHKYWLTPLRTKAGWMGEAKVLCILHHRGIQLILAYSCARPAVLAAGKGRGGMFHFFFSFTFIHFPFSLVLLFHLIYYLFSLLHFSERRHKMTHKGWHVVKPQLNQLRTKEKVCLGKLTGWTWL